MNIPTQHPIVTHFLRSRNFQFWTLHVGGWVGLSVVTFLSLNLLYNQPELVYLAHNILQSALGILLCWPMRHIFRALWDSHWLKRITLIFATVLGLSFVWAAARLVLFLSITDAVDLWSDFGGWLFPSIFIFLCWTALYHGIKYYRLFQDQQQRSLELDALRQSESLKLSQAESAAKNAQLAMLRYQLNPHFLFNTLNAVSSLVAQGNNAKANEMILHLSEFLRHSLDSDPLQVVSLRQELEAARLYLQIEQVRFGDRLRVTIKVDDDAAACGVPGLLLQPIIENAIKYAIAPAEQGGSILITGCVKRGRLEISVADSGPGVGAGASKPGTGVGLRNTRERLQTIYGGGCDVNVVASETGGTDVHLTMPATNCEDKVA